MALPSFRVVVNSFEAKPWPIVTHIFHGESLQEAVGFYEAHKKSDSFLQECGEKGSFKNKFRCHNKVFYQERKRKKWFTVRQFEAPVVRAVP